MRDNVLDHSTRFARCGIMDAMSSRQWVENCASFDVGEARTQEGVFTTYGRLENFVPKCVVGQFARLVITWQDGRKLGTVDVEITTTRLHYGGERRWFVCPDCHGRAKKLLTRGGEQGGRITYALGCRKCLGLVYRCQYCKSPFLRLTGRAR